MDERTPETDEPLTTRSPDGGLALAFFGSIAVGMVTPVIPCLLFGWLRALLGLSMFGASLGIFWGFLTVIGAAAAECENRRAMTLRMFAIFAVSLLVFGMAIFGWPYAVWFLGRLLRVPLGTSVLISASQ